MKITVASVLLVLVVACGGDNDGAKTTTPPPSDTPSPTLTLSMDTPVLALAPGGAQIVTVNLARTGSLVGAAVALTTTNAPAGVTLSFDSASATADTATLTIVAANDAVATTSAMTITGTAGTIASSAGLTITISATPDVPTTITVHGTVASPSLKPLAGIPVSIWSHGATTAATTTSGADGSFTVENVTPPYDAMMAPPTLLAAIFVGLTRTDPLLTDLGQHSNTQTDTIVSVTVSGSLPADALVNTVVTCGQADGNGTSGTTTTPAPLFGNYATAEACNVQALEYTAAPGDFASSFSFGAGTVTPVVSATTDASIALQAAVPTHAVDVHAVTAEGAPFSVNSLWRFDDSRNPATLTNTENTTELSQTVTAPDDPAAGIGLVFDHQELDGAFIQISTYLSAKVTAIDYTVPAIPGMTAPADGTTGFDPSTASFSWNANGPGVYYVLLSGPGVRAIIATTSTSVPASAFAAHGFAFQAGQVYSVQYLELSDVVSVDDAASPLGSLAHASNTDGGFYLQSHGSGFTTAAAASAPPPGYPVY